MKFCPHCNAALDDAATFCSNCGANLAGGVPNPGMVNPAPYAPVVPNYDHTAEFDPADISENKVIAMLPYLMSILGAVVATILARNSKYVAFHVKQALKFSVCSILLGIVTAVLFWTVIIPIVTGVCFAIIFVLEIIQFFSVCGGKAKEPAIIRELKFLK